jgi:hypothetical protein
VFGELFHYVFVLLLVIPELVPPLPKPSLEEASLVSYILFSIDRSFAQIFVGFYIFLQS